MYNAIVLGLVANPDHMGEMEDAEFSGQSGIQNEGPWMVVHLRTDGERIAYARFQTYGCPAAIACGNWITQWLEGKTADAARLIEIDDLTRMVGGLPLGKEHCARLTIAALRSALTSWEEGRSVERGVERH